MDWYEETNEFEWSPGPRYGGIITLGEVDQLDFNIYRPLYHACDGHLDCPEMPKSGAGRYFSLTLSPY